MMYRVCLLLDLESQSQQVESTYVETHHEDWEVSVLRLGNVFAIHEAAYSGRNDRKHSS